ncbi:hypothetical protein AAFF_G00273240 [Aldrovandia affinis]|uniref:Endoplasmic reticulum transmembrane protein n=1 Tax=Aldrovandia affinis TaxID=143900 RepID=A0AAD7SSP1_9TELE|nr:hypothetical protein AAFF_G00273240 [Aldrovandia affinis]
MAVIIFGLLFLIYHLFVSPFALDVFQDANKHVIPYLIGYLKKFGGFGRQLLANENYSDGQGSGHAYFQEDPFLKHGTDAIQDSYALMVIPPKEWQGDSILLAMSTVIRVTVVILTVLGLVWRAVLIVKSWKCLLRENEHLKKQNEILEYSCETLRKILDVREKESKQELRKRSERMREEINHLKAALRKEIMAKKNNDGGAYSAQRNCTIYSGGARGPDE